MSRANETTQDKAIHDYLEALLLDIPDEDGSSINTQTPQVKLVKTDIQSLPHEEPKVETPAVIGLENLVAQVPTALPEVETVTVIETVTETIVEAVVETETEAAIETVDSGVPDWAEERFQCLIFNVSGLSLAVPLVKLNSVISWNEDEITKTPNQTSWYLGLIQHLEKQVKVIDTALLVMPENRRNTLEETSLNRLGNILLVDDFKWGLACDSIGDVIWLSKEDVKWRKNKQTRAWLSGTSLEHLCAIMDTEVFAQMLTESPK
jgi:purine-binding chemotaxis protein CheW